MKTSNVSEPAFSNSIGWFRYNYDENRLEFLNHNTKLVVQTWDIPADQWEALPSQQEYCENIVSQAAQQVQKQAATNQKAKSRALIIFIVSAIIAAVCWYIDKTDSTLKYYVIELIAISVAVVSLGAFLTNKQ